MYSIKAFSASRLSLWILSHAPLSFAATICAAEQRSYDLTLYYATFFAFCKGVFRKKSKKSCENKYSVFRTRIQCFLTGQSLFARANTASVSLNRSLLACDCRSVNLKSIDVAVDRGKSYSIKADFTLSHTVKCAVAMINYNHFLAVRGRGNTVVSRAVNLRVALHYRVELVLCKSAERLVRSSITHRVINALVVTARIGQVVYAVVL